MTELSLTVSRTINATPKAVYDAWLNPEMLARFMIPGPGMSVPKAANDPVEGGRFDITMVADGNEMPHGGVYKKLSPHSQIVFSWESPFSVDGSTVTLDFKKVTDGTEITLHHVRFPDEQSRDNHNGGWTGILAALETALA